MVYRRYRPQVTASQRTPIRATAFGSNGCQTTASIRRGNCSSSDRCRRRSNIRLPRAAGSAGAPPTVRRAGLYLEQYSINDDKSANLPHAVGYGAEPRWRRLPLLINAVPCRLEVWRTCARTDAVLLEADT